MTPEERKKFLEEHRLAVVGIPRRSAPPQLSPVYYVVDGDDLLISTTATRAKGKSVLHEPRVSVCVLGEAMPFPYLTVYGRGRIGWTTLPEKLQRDHRDLTIADVLRIQHLLGQKPHESGRALRTVLSGVPVDPRLHLVSRHAADLDLMVVVHDGLP